MDTNLVDSPKADFILIPFLCQQEIADIVIRGTVSSDAVVGNVILLIGGKDLLSLQVLTLDLIEQICVAAVSDVVQDGLRCNGSLLVFEELRQRSCGEGRAHIRNHISDDAFQQVHVTDLVPLHNVLELDRVEQVMKVEFGSRSCGCGFYIRKYPFVG